MSKKYLIRLVVHQVSERRSRNLSWAGFGKSFDKDDLSESCHRPDGVPHQFHHLVHQRFFALLTVYKQKHTKTNKCTSNKVYSSLWFPILCKVAYAGISLLSANTQTSLIPIYTLPMLYFVPHRSWAHIKPEARVPSGGPPAPPRHSPPQKGAGGQTEGHTHNIWFVGTATKNMLVVIICVVSETLPLLAPPRGRRWTACDPPRWWRRRTETWCTKSPPRPQTPRPWCRSIPTSECDKNYFQCKHIHEWYV